MRILHTSPAQDGFFMPAEFAPHDGCLMIWPERGDSWQYGAYAARRAFIQVMRTIAESEKLTVLYSEGQYDNARAQLPDAVRLVVMETDDAWARDVGPTFVIDGFGVAANILPAMGFAMLGRLVLTKQLVPFYFLGFLLCSYANVPVLGVALIAIIIGIDKYDLLGLGGAQSQLSVEGDEDDDF